MKLVTSNERAKSLKDELERIVGIIRTNYAPEKIVLFGSLATEHIHEWSDIDLLIIKRTDKRPIERTMELVGLVKPKVGIDLFIYTPEEYELLINERYSFILNVIKTGKTVYEKGS
jgi:predicted nucleotidyltransferase